MADITFNKDNVIIDNPISTVRSGETRKVGRKVAGEDLEAGQPVRIVSNKAYHSQATTSVATANCIGITTNTAAAGQSVSYIDGDDIDFGAGVFTIGQIYVVSGTKGKIAPYSDLISEQGITILGVATTATNLSCQIHESGVLKP